MLTHWATGPGVLLLLFGATEVNAAAATADVRPRIPKYVVTQSFPSPGEET